MSDVVAELSKLATSDDTSAWVSNLWDKYDHARSKKLGEYQELQKYLFATDTTTTSNQTLPWSNTTTLPKLCQIRDNLFSNYKAALFPKDDWLLWEAHSKEDATKEKASSITAYMSNKIREGHFEDEQSKMLLDYIDYGNSFATVSFESRYKTYKGEKVADFIGPVTHRINPRDIVFNPMADKFENTFKIVRSVKGIGELLKLSQTEPEHQFWEKAITRRRELKKAIGAMREEDVSKAIQYEVDGFGSIYEYYMSDYIEILDFYGDYYDSNTGVLKTDVHLTIAERSMVVREEEIQTYTGRAPIRHVGWRKRQDNLWAMGPLDNLVGLQYRIDHLQNGNADARDGLLHPMLKIIGNVEEFEISPNGKILIDEDGDVQELQRGLNHILTTDNHIQELMDTMEMMAGAPREAMGIRSPGEKTALEVQLLDNAAGRIFQEKITTYEKELLEPNLNDMLEISHRNLDILDTIRVIDTDLGAVEFREITKEDITSNGIIRPVGARHFAQQAQDLQNLIGVFNSPIGQLLQPHTSGIELSKYVESITNISGYTIFKPNVAIEEQEDTARSVNQSAENLEVESEISIPEA